MKTKEPDYIKQIEAEGWEIEHSNTFPFDAKPYRATQGSFSTPWLKSWEEVLEWVAGNEKASKQFPQ